MILLRDIVLWLSVAAVVTLGVVVYLTNPKRTVNQHYATTTALITGWMLCLVIGFRAQTGAEGAFWIRQASAIGSCIVMGFNMLRLAIIHPADSWARVIWRMRWWWILHIPVLLLCQTEFFLIDATIPSTPANAIAEPNYGPGFSLYAIYTMGSLLVVWGLFIRNTMQHEGMVKAELQYSLLACFSFLCFGGLMTIFLPWITGGSQTVRVSFINAIILEGIIGYGIARRSILSMTSLLRSAIAYILLAAYLLLVYFAVWLGTDRLLTAFIAPHPFVAHMAAALVMALSVAPAEGSLQRFARGLFINLQPLDTEQTLQRAQTAMRAVATVPKLVQELIDILRDATGTDRVLILIRQDHHFALPEGVQVETQPITLHQDEPIVQQLNHGSLLTRDALARNRQTDLAVNLHQRLSDLDLEVLLPLHIRGELAGMVCLGRRLSGRFYSSAEQRTLELLGTQAEVALENATLFSQAMDSRIYNEILLDNLPSGVIAVDAGGDISIINREAGALLQQPPGVYLERPYSALPAPLPDYVRHTIADGRQQRNLNVELCLTDEHRAPVRLSYAPVHGHQGDRLGALLVFDDLSAIRNLQEQVQHSDRLASIGRLSAGMAHEIKNPLVTIKTFAQLLPEQVDDPEFRNSFANLVSNEIDRIDRIVGQLLQFSRPSPPTFAPLQLHSIIDSAAELINYQISKRRVDLKTHYLAQNDRLMGDEELLRQAFVNLILNALEAIDAPGHLQIKTVSATADILPPGCQAAGAEHWLLIQFQDSGCGMTAEQIKHVFEPFYTTKTKGTGLGLAVVHGIINDHQGHIKVTSQADQGTTFHVYLPTKAQTRP